MKKLRSLLILFLMLCMITTMSLATYALPVNATLQDKAEFLDDLNILAGSNGDYHLNDQLTRSEAAALAVRILGKELHVLVNASTYKYTSYPDVDAGIWYAPYVGYCTQEGILSGDTTGNYKPDESITEKAFVKIVLSILGYQMDKDYTWVNIYKKAYEVGLVTDLFYIAKQDDNPNFKRSGAVNIIYNALTIREKNTGKELFHQLIDSGTITTEDATRLGLIKDAVATEIEEILVFNETSVSIQFNEDIKDYDDIYIYEATDEDEELDYEIEDEDDSYILLKTKRHKPGTEYTIEITDIEDMDGNKKDVLYAAFIGFAPTTVESDFFRIQKIDPINEKSVKVYFTHPVNMNSENSIYYSIFEEEDVYAEGQRGQLLARTINSETNCVLLSLQNGTFEEDASYTVDISGSMTSAYGVKLNDGLGDDMYFTAVDGEEDSFKLDEVIPYDKETLLLSFNKEVNPFLAEQVYNFYITDADNKPMKIEKVALESQGPRTGEVIYINMDGKFTKDEKYYITINNLNDVTRQEYITEMTYSFVADYGSADDFDIEDVEDIDEQTVEVYFSAMPDPESATNESYYVVSPRRGTGKIYPVRALYDLAIHPYKVVLYFEKGELEGKKEYELKVDYEFKDYLGNKAGVTLKERFNASDEEKTSPSIEEAVPISTDAVKLVFDKELAFNQNNLSPSNYTMEYSLSGMSIRKLPLSVLYVNARTLVLKFDKLEYDTKYTLKFTSLVDYSGSSYKVTGDGRNYVEFMLEEE